MSIETDTADETDSVEDLARSLGDAIAELPVYEDFLEAKAAVEQSDQAQAQIAEFEATREEYLDARERGEASREDLLELQAAQEELHEIPVMSEFLQARNDLELRLQALNEAVSAPLDVDFGEKAGGCCAE